MDFPSENLDWLQNPQILKAFYLLAAYVALTLLSQLVKRSINRKFQDNNIRVKLRTSVTVIFSGLLLVFALSLFSSTLSSFTIALGVAGAGIAFALQEVIASVAGWFAIHLGHFFKIGDRVLLGGIKGDVIEIGFLRTTMMELGAWVQGDQYNGRVVRIANSFVFKEPVFNYSADFPFVWDEVVIPIKHGSDIQASRKILEDVTERILGDYEAKAHVEWNRLVDKFVIENAQIGHKIYLAADANWMNFTIRYVTDFKQRRTTKDLLFENILSAIHQSDKVELGIASMEVYSYQKSPAPH